jgi:hypothetical protein
MDTIFLWLQETRVSDSDGLSDSTLTEDSVMDEVDNKVFNRILRTASFLEATWAYYAIISFWS